MVMKSEDVKREILNDIFRPNVIEKLTDAEQIKVYTMLRVGPDLRIYASCYDLFN